MTPKLLPFLLLVVVGFFVPISMVRSEPPSEALALGATTFYGDESIAQFTFEVAKSNVTPSGVLELKWAVSSLVDQKLSNLTVLIDGRPLTTMALSSLLGSEDRGPLSDRKVSLSLGKLTPGFHQLTLRTRLRAQTDVCLAKIRQDVWLALLPGSSVIWNAGARAALSLTDFPRVWQTRQADDDSRKVAVVVDSEQSVDANLTLIEADHLLRDWGVQPIHSSEPEARNGNAFIVKVIDPKQNADRLGGTWRAMHSALMSKPKAVAIASVQHRAVYLLARDQSGARAGIGLLRADRVRSMCGQQPCVLGPYVDRVSPVPGQDAQSADARAWTLQEKGFPQGWQVSGAGDHTLRLSWARPLNWKLTNGQQLRLNVRVADTALLDYDASSIDVRVNGVPLASYRIRKASIEAVSLLIDIPQYMWASAEWLIDLKAGLVLKDASTCAQISASAIWLSVEPDSALYAPHQLLHYDGLSGYFHATAQQLPRLRLSEPINPGEVGFVAAALYPFHKRDPLTQWQRWQDKAASACIEVTRVDQVEAGARVAGRLDVARTNNGIAWVDESGKLDIPVLSVQDTLSLSYMESDKCLSVRVGPASQSVAVAAPELSSILARQALLHDGRWSVFDQADQPSKTSMIGASAGRDLEVLASERGRRALWLNALWGVVALIVLAFALILFWRRGKKGAEVGTD